jgi:hypothetical protein
MEVELYCGAGVGLLFSFYNSMLLIPVYTPGHAKIHSTDGFLIQNQLWLCTNIQAHLVLKCFSISGQQTRVILVNRP